MLRYKQNEQESVKKLLKLLRLIKLKKELAIPAEAIHEAGVLMGYTCPRCGKRHCIYEFCLACGQRLYYDYMPAIYGRYETVEEMCKNIDEKTNLLIKTWDESELGPINIKMSMTERRRRSKIELSDLI